jgi:hypothetical protein
MSYRGKTADFPCGLGGLDGNQNVYQIPKEHLVKARNIRFDGFCWRKAPGLAKFDTVAVANSANCYAGIDWRPSPSIQTQITSWDDGAVYKEAGGDIDAVEIANSLTITEPVVFVEAGQIAAGQDRTLLMFSKGNTPLQLKNDNTAMEAFTNSSVDWSVSKPGAAIMHDSRVFAFDVDSAPHSFYISSLNDHTDFNAGDSRVYSIAPGIGSRLVCAMSYQQNKMIVGKYPRGLWSVDTSDLIGFYLPIQLIRDDVGPAGPFAMCRVENDIMMISSNGRLYSLNTLSQSDNPDNADITQKLRLTQFIKDNVDASKLKFARLVYDEIRRELHYIFTSVTGDTNNMAIVFDLNEDGNPKCAIEDRGSYFQAVWKRIASTGFNELLCAGNGGFVRRMNQESRSVDGTVPYGSELQYASTDLDWVTQNVYKPVPVGSVQKRFDFLEITLLPTGAVTGTVEFIVDGISIKTETFSLGGEETVFDSIDPGDAWDAALFSGQLVIKHRVPIDCVGNQLSFRVYNSAANEDFALVNFRLYFQLQGQDYEA